MGVVTAKPEQGASGKGNEQAEGKEAADKDGPSLALTQPGNHFQPSESGAATLTDEICSPY